MFILFLIDLFSFVHFNFDINILFMFKIFIKKQSFINHSVGQGFIFFRSEQFIYVFFLFILMIYFLSFISTLILTFYLCLKYLIKSNHSGTIQSGMDLFFFIQNSSFMFFNLYIIFFIDLFSFFHFNPDINRSFMFEIFI